MDALGRFGFTPAFTFPYDQLDFVTRILGIRLLRMAAARLRRGRHALFL